MEIKDEIKNLIKKALKNLNIDSGIDFSVEHPADLKMGDYSSNVAMVLAKKQKSNPRDLAEKIVIQLKSDLEDSKRSDFERVEAQNSFINFYLSSKFFRDNIKKIIKNKNYAKNDLFKGKKVMIEYTQPNPFKPFHIGHLMSNAIGESLSRLFEAGGAKVVRANYQGDIGPHVAKAIYMIMKNPLPTLPLTKGEGKGGGVSEMSISIQAEYIGECYSKGSNLYNTDENAKREIDEINKKIYERSDPKINDIYAWGRKITLEAFEEVYKILGTKFDKYYFESGVAKIGEKIVKAHVSKIFEKSDGAIIFRGEKYDSKLHTRVFLNSQGLPTYETKELGLTMSKFKAGFLSRKLNLSAVVTAVEQAEYMKVVEQVLYLIKPELKGKLKHITHGMMQLVGGKMSSRKGNVITGESLLCDTQKEIIERVKDRNFPEEEKKRISEIVSVAALKYSILKQAIGGNIIFDFEKSISFEGDSGPYLQYSYTRAKSILEKARTENINLATEPPSDINLATEPPSDWEITEVEKMLYRFPEMVLRSAKEYEPHYIANYLIELARAFNTFYGQTKIVDKNDPTSPYKIALTQAFSIVVKNGLFLLGIKVPEKM
jgi:arginyl-tRNA synthetase